MTDAFTANDATGRALLAARIAMAFVAWLALVARDDRAGRALFAVACGAFVGSLAVRALLAPFAIIVVVSAARGLARAKTRERISAAVAIVGAAAVAAFALTRPPPPSPPSDFSALTARWIAKDNPFRARFWATKWANAERDAPGDGMLARARLDWELGHRDNARGIAAHVAAHGRDDDVRARATKLLEEWR